MKRPTTSIILAGVLAYASLIEAQTLQTLCSFNGANGAYPNNLILGSDGNFYGTTSSGGSFSTFNSTSDGGYYTDGGTVFKVTTNGVLTILFMFDSTNGAGPEGLTLGNDGYFYGTTSKYGSDTAVPGNYYEGGGTVFRITTNGTLTKLAFFGNGLDGNASEPLAALTKGNNGNFYGTTISGGSSYSGTIFQVTTNGTFTTLVSFNNNANGSQPTAALALGNDGNFYGTTETGGNNNLNPGTFSGLGTVFMVTTNGTLTTLFSFSGTNGAFPARALTLGSDGIFYGTTCAGGSVAGGSLNYGGTLFKITTNGILNTLVSFGGSNDKGETPNTLTQGNDGNLYGTTGGGTFQADGTVFRVTTNGKLTTLFAFNDNEIGSNGVEPGTGLTLGSDGNFYGTTSSGGSGGFGTVFRLLLPPIVSVLPQSQTNNAGATVSFNVSANSINPIVYQWQKNGTNLVDGGNVSGSTTNLLTITGISDSDASVYGVVVGNANASITNYATLTVIDPPVITAQPTNQLTLPGPNISFAVSLTGSAPLQYQWLFNGADLPSATNAVYSISAVTTNKAGNYTLLVSNAAGSVASSNVALTVVLSPQSQTKYAGSMATLTGTAFSPESLNYQWQKSGTNLFDGGNLSGTTNSTLSIATVSDADAAIYNLVVSDATGSVITSNAMLTVNDLPFVATQPQCQTVLPGSDVTFTASAYGASPLMFQWYFGNTPVGSPISGTNVSTYTLTDVGTNQAGNYTVKVVNSYGNVTSSNAVLIVSVPPVITGQPASRTNAANSFATFSVTVSNLSALSYQWQQNGTNLVNGGKFSGANSNTLTITGVSSNEATVYAVAITNLAGAVTSSNATLTVVYPPVITTQPLGQRLVLGCGTSFNVAVSGTAPFRFQWRFNSVSLLNATNASYTIQAVGPNSTGNYSVVVTNLAGSVTSSNALLVALVPPSLALQLWAGYPMLNLNGTLSNNFAVQYSTDLTGTNWITLLSLSNLLTSPYQFLDPAGVVPPTRFYRAVMQ
jgi:uncharacterized repeat protein (TIGR03803 family)